jgi:hypothetical protein
VAIIASHVGNPDWKLAEFVDGSLPSCHAVGNLILQGGMRVGTCVRVSPQWILTAHHVVDVPDLARNFTASHFGFISKGARMSRVYELDADHFFTSEDGIQGQTGDHFELDYALIRLKGRIDADDPALAAGLRITFEAPRIGSRGRIPQFDCVVPQPGDAVCLSDRKCVGDDPPEVTCPEPLRLEEPRGDPQAGTFTVCDDPEHPHLFHKCSTDKGQSGCPIFDEKWNLVGLHTHGRKSRFPDPIRRANNWGTRIECIVRDAHARGFRHLGEIPLFQRALAR